MSLSDKEVMAALNAVSDANIDPVAELPGAHQGHVGAWGACEACEQQGRNNLFLDIVRQLSGRSEDGRVDWRDLMAVTLGQPLPDRIVREDVVE